MKVKTLKTVFKIFLIHIVCFLIVSCHQNNLKENVALSPISLNDSHKSTTNELQDTNQPNETSSQKHLKIITTAQVRYKVKKVKAATKIIKQQVTQHHGYISDLKFENNLYKLENRFTIKIPQQHFEAMMDSIVQVADFVDYENITTEDVTAQYVDIQTRLKTKLEVKARYEAILRKNAKTVEDILATEEKLRVIQEEIEAAQGKINYLSHKVAYSTIEIDLYETFDYEEEPESYTKTFWSKLKEGVLFGGQCIETIFIGLIYIWPFLIIGAILLYSRKYRKNRIKK